MFSTVRDVYNQTMEHRDRRVDGWFMMDNPLPTLVIVACYVYLVKFAGPKFMKNREPFQFKRLLLVYNVTMVFFSFYLFYEVARLTWGNDYNFRCQPVDYSYRRRPLRIARACYWYYISKFIELADTIFFVLRKKQNQVSTLHVVHHGVMPISVWFGVRFTPGGHSTFFGLLNTFVHVFMYAYYTIAALGPQYQKFLWWKRYLTSLQIIQFVVVMIHSFQLFFIECNYPMAFVYVIGGHSVMFFLLFADFYKQSYGKKVMLSKKLDSEQYKNGHAITANGHSRATNGELKKRD